MPAGCGRTGPDPTADITLEDGTIVPVGKGTSTSVANTSLLYNEYPLALTTLRPHLFHLFLVVTGGGNVRKVLGREEEEALCFTSHRCLNTPNVLFYLFPFVYSQSHSLSLVGFKSLNRHIPYLLSLLKPLLMVRTI